MKISNLLILLIGIISIMGCTNESPLISEEESIVVWAYLYSDEPVNSIRLTTTISLDSEESDPPPINNAFVTLIKDGQRYECVPSPGDSGYYHYEGADLTIETFDEFTIEIEYLEKMVTAKTVVPESPAGVQISSTTFVIPDFSDRRSLFEWRQSENREISVSWENSEDDFYYVTLVNIESNPVAIESFFSERAREIIFPPINDDNFAIRLPMITHLGKHKITVYRVNQEYVDLYESRNQDSRDLNEPLTNIVNGLGVFTAFNSDSAFITITQN